jgi:hypothetical protein
MVSSQARKLRLRRAGLVGAEWTSPSIFVLSSGGGLNVVPSLGHFTVRAATGVAGPVAGEQKIRLKTAKVSVYTVVNTCI